MLRQKPNKDFQVFTSSAIAGFLASAFSLPFDFVKTQMQKQKPDPVFPEWLRRLPAHDAANLTGLILDCIETKFCK